ncbi:hypothetical protein [Azospirillum halopraeferens]|uniref:hypothetical protein n=1 Tax=Azospirillum halopraeferens TaxID=34010 RepID=UPI00049026E7|nr:hypothetical protein [Azospirillum halopraeferens]
MTARKAGVLLVEVRNTPLESGEPRVRGAIGRAGVVWMAWMRVLTWGAAGFLLWVVMTRRHCPPAAVAAAALGAGFAALYAAPYVVGFAYERHAVAAFLPFLVAAVYAYDCCPYHASARSASAPCSTSSCRP